MIISTPVILSVATLLWEVAVGIFDARVAKLTEKQRAEGLLGLAALRARADEFFNAIEKKVAP